MDTDGDGIPDGWEIAYGLDPSANDAQEDSDGDGRTNYEEYLAGTNPADADDQLRLQANITANGKQVVLSFVALRNKTYSILYRGEADTGDWLKLLNVAGEASDRSVSVTNSVSPATGSMFYRLATPRIP
jgi:hypothetical protein